MVRVSHLTAVASDHDPIILQWQQVSGGKGRKKRKMFRYEMMWEAHDEIFPMLAKTWLDAGKACTVKELQEKLALVLCCLSEWGRQIFWQCETGAEEPARRIRAPMIRPYASWPIIHRDKGAGEDC